MVFSCTSKEVCKSVGGSPASTSIKMEKEDFENFRKRMKQMENGEAQVSDGAIEEVAEGDAKMTHVGSEEVEHQIAAIHEKVDRYTQQVSELLDAGKTLFKDLSNNFEERLITIHKK